MVKSILHKADINEHFMFEAIKEAKKAASIGEVPVGAVIVSDGKVVSRAHNQRIKKNSAIAHAEIEAIQKATKKNGDWRLEGMAIYVTVEPCLMCAGALVHSRIKKLVYGCCEPKMGAVSSQYGVLDNKRAHHQVKIISGILEEQCAELLKAFFKDKRKKR